jgi:hypothetical protein
MVCKVIADFSRKGQTAAGKAVTHRVSIFMEVRGRKGLTGCGTVRPEADSPRGARQPFNLLCLQPRVAILSEAKDRLKGDGAAIGW